MTVPFRNHPTLIFEFRKHTWILPGIDIMYLNMTFIVQSKPHTHYTISKQGAQSNSGERHKNKLWKIQPDKFTEANCCTFSFFSPCPLPLILLLSGWIFHRNTHDCHWAANKTSSPLPIGWRRHVTSAPRTKGLPEQCQEGKWGRREGAREEGWWRGSDHEEEDDDRSRWGGRVSGFWGELTHMWEDRAALLMGREKYNNLNKRGW